MATTTRTRTARPRKTDEQRDTEIAELKATLDAAVQRLADSPEQWVEFLDVVAQFAARYSANNQLLILCQAAERGFSPTMVRPYGSRDRATGKAHSGWAGGWLALDRNVTKGEKALKIWRPMLKRFTDDDAASHAAKTGRAMRRNAKGQLPQRVIGFSVASVFDVSQTEGADVAMPEPVTVRRRVLAAGGQRPELLTGADTTDAQDELVKLIKDAGYSFEYTPAAALHGANGDTSADLRRVRVRDDVESAQQVKTTVHELAHILCGHVDPSYAYHLHRGQAETEAESVAYIVLGAMGLDSERYSAPYVATWAEGDMAKVAASAGLIVKTARTILAALEGAASEDDTTDE